MASKTRTSGQRFSVPPYYAVGMMSHAAVPVLPGVLYSGIERHLAISSGEARTILLRLRSRLRWSRPMLAAFLGVGLSSLRSWETGKRNPCGAARRLIWLLNTLVTESGKLTNGIDLIVWGKGEELTAFARSFDAP